MQYYLEKCIQLFGNMALSTQMASQFRDKEIALEQGRRYECYLKSLQ